MAETTERVGKYDVRVAFCAPAENGDDYRERRVQALTTWLLAEFNRKEQEADDVECRSAS
jgi:hypothetical protein